MPCFGKLMLFIRFSTLKQTIACNINLRSETGPSKRVPCEGNRRAKDW
jgi:hypothetical protein